MRNPEQPQLYFSLSLFLDVCVWVCVSDGGLDEVVEEMNGGKCLYAFMRVKDPNTQLPKNVLINWVWCVLDHSA